MFIPNWSPFDIICSFLILEPTLSVSNSSLVEDKKVTSKTRNDIIKILQMKGLPYELTDLILDYAEYWITNCHVNSTYISGENLNYLYIQTNLIKDLTRCMKIVVEISSHDQGWATGPGSFTWTEFAIVHLDGTEERWEAYRNDRGQIESKVRTFEMTRQLSCIQQFTKLDSFAVWIRSQYPGWSNHVDYCKLELYYK
ncbi:hypothetical protein BC833DRAFT_651312 [Globomyces pollinis-pini]|nr:hypothetical protein BC833DRAFT_651312 [Globomyces pollinis-pini]